VGQPGSITLVISAGDHGAGMDACGAIRHNPLNKIDDDREQNQDMGDPHFPVEYVTEKARMFFFEKKNQKTFGL